MNNSKDRSVKWIDDIVADATKIVASSPERDKRWIAEMSRSAQLGCGYVIETSGTKRKCRKSA